ncbi:PAS domain-containing sensor histidine kinase [Sulfurospirillum oryzae]|uniref:PAS domain-containing sensor histidine kinase n=1 Tax=Sulfurospirillum oryzae TaxID=2976535 RepID=UPI0021E8AD19|nr:PAS domain S-box protein [Sulfurospirillum oryzae]
MSFDFLKNFYDSMREGLYAFDNDGKITHFNASAQKILGYDEAELLGKIGHFIFHAHHEKQGLLQCSLYKAFLQGEPYEGEDIFLTKDGRWINVCMRANPIFEKGVKKGYVVLFWSIATKNRRDNEAMLDEVASSILCEKSDFDESEAFYEQIFETANLGICLTDKEGRFVAVNAAYSKIYGYSEAELIGKHFQMIIPEENHDNLHVDNDSFLTQRKLHNDEYEAIRKDGKRIFVYASEGILDHIIGGPYKITTISDITEMVESRKLQKEQEAMLIQQNKLAAMGEMIGHIAHQWRQPLNVMNITTLDLKFKQELGSLNDEKLKSALGVIESLTEQMSNTINDFMNFYKPNKDKKDFSLYETVLYATNIIAPQLKHEAISLSLNIDSKLRLHGLANELQQVILNLITNAKDAFASKDLETKQICVVAWSSNDGISLCVEDNAGGIDEALLERIFEPYFTTKGQMQGSGIGLYICSMIMKESFGGRIKVENISYEDDVIGARFILEFPNY